MSEEMNQGAIQDAAGNTGSISVRDAASLAIDQMSEPEESANSETVETESKQKESPTETKEFDWAKYPEAQKHFEELKKTHDNYRSHADRKFTEWKQKEKEFDSLRQKAENYDKWNSKYEGDPKFREAVELALGAKKPVDQTLESDPLFNYIKDYQNGVDKQLREAMDFIKSERESRRQAELERETNAIIDSGKNAYKSLFGKDLSREDEAKFLDYVTSKRVYDGDSAIRALFMEDAINTRIQKALDEQMAKKGKTTKTSTVQSSKATTPKGDTSPREFLMEYLSQYEIPN